MVLWDRSDLCHLLVHSGRWGPQGLKDPSHLWARWDHLGQSLLSVPMDQTVPWLPSLLPDPKDLMGLLHLWILPVHWGQRDRRGLCRPLGRLDHLVRSDPKVPWDLSLP